MSLITAAVFVIPAYIITCCYTLIIYIIWKNSHLLTPKVKHNFTSDTKKLMSTNSTNGEYFYLKSLS